MNSRAEKLFGVKAEDVVGRPCHEVVAGQGPEGARCRSSCPQLAALQRNAVPLPQTLKIGHNGSSRWIQVMPILRPTHAGSGCVVETAVEVDRWARIETYVKNVAASEQVRPPCSDDVQLLTQREGEVLSMLAEGLSQHGVAQHLHVSYTTIRTHTQRILSKLGVSSIQAAVAQYLLH